MHYSITHRMKRLRSSHNIRSMLAETRLNINQFIAPIFINDNITTKNPVKSMPGQFVHCIDSLNAEIDSISNLNIPAVLLFGVPKYKDEVGSCSTIDDGIIQRAIQKIRAHNPDITIIADVCLCEYTSHGHCGILNKHNRIDNDKTLDILAKQAVSFANAGADIVAPSSMTDGMVGAIRTALDKNLHQETAILSYAVKYSSNFYGPFREALEGAPKFGDRKSYFMNHANAKEAIREAFLDIEEGADILMVKPAMNYLDIIHQIKYNFPEIPLCAYQVSGEYAMIKLGAQNGLFDEEQMILESLLAIKRAGADLIISYFAKDIAKLISG